MVEKMKQQGHRDFSVYWVETRGRRKEKEEKEGEPARVTCQAHDFKWKGIEKEKGKGICVVGRKTKGKKKHWPAGHAHSEEEGKEEKEGMMGGS